MTDSVGDIGVERVLQVALNGDSDHPAMPRTTDEIAADAAGCVAAARGFLTRTAAG